MTLLRSIQRLAFPTADDLFEEPCRPLTGNFGSDAPVLTTRFRRDPGASLNLSSPVALHVVLGLVQAGQQLGGERGTLIRPKRESLLQKTVGCVSHAAILPLRRPATDVRIIFFSSRPSRLCVRWFFSREDAMRCSLVVSG